MEPGSDPVMSLACPWCKLLVDVAPFRIFGQIDWRQREAPTFVLARGLQQMPCVDIACPHCEETILLALACYAVKVPQDLPVVGAISVRDDLVGQRRLAAVDEEEVDDRANHDAAQSFLEAIIRAGRAPTDKELAEARRIARGAAGPDTAVGRYLDRRAAVADAVTPSVRESPRPAASGPATASAPTCTGGCGRAVPKAGDRCILCIRGGIPTPA